MKNDLQNRLFTFAIEVLKFLRDLPNNPEYKVIRYQLTKSATSAGANYEESQAGSSKADFRNKVRIALREMRESNYWLRIIFELGNEDNLKDITKRLIQESDELMRILGSIVSKTK